MLETEQELNQKKLVGREWILAELAQWYQNGGDRACLIAPPGAGKTRIARAFAETIPGSVVLDFSNNVYGHEWPIELTSAEMGGRPSLLVLDSVESAPPIVWRSRRLARDFTGIPTLLCHRPGVHHDSLQTPGSLRLELNPADPRHQADLNAYLIENNLTQLSGMVSTFAEAKFFTGNPAQSEAQLTAWYLALWRETTRPHSGTTRILMEQLALLLADTPEPISFGAMADFTGIPSVQILEALDQLSPLVTGQGPGFTLYSPGFASCLKGIFSRDLGAVHGRIVSFFRDTYPSWQEMHDPYGWRYLVLHCDRLARSSRRKDFSILHWLNEGSFSNLKLERTGMLPSVLKDLQLSLLASLETDDLPRIVSFGCRIAKLRKQESIKTVHRLADAGCLDLAQENGRLLTGESQRFLVWLLFATQTIEASQYEETYRFLSEAESFATVSLSDLEVELAASLIGGLLTNRSLTENTRTLLHRLLEMNQDPRQACLALKTVARNWHLPKLQRRGFLESALEFAQQLYPGQEKIRVTRELESRLARATKDGPREKAYPLFLAEAKDSEKEFQKRLKLVHKRDLAVATLAAALIPVSREGWVPKAFGDLVTCLDDHTPESGLLHALAGLIQSLEDSFPKDLPTPLLDDLSEKIIALEDPTERSRYLARFAVLLSRKGRPLEAQQRISLAAATAFGIGETAGRSIALLLLAEMVAMTGALGRARDLTFHALELRAKLHDLDLESQQLVQMLSSASAQENQSAEEIVRLGSSLRFEDTPAELEAKGRALVLLAAGLSRLGADHHAKLYRTNAAEAVRAIDQLDLRIHLLADLASAFHSSGEEREARKLIKEAKALFDAEKDARSLMSSTALLKVYMVVENKTQTKKIFEVAREFLDLRPPSEWLVTPSFLQLLYLAQGLGRVQEILPALAEPRKAQDLNDHERLGVLRAEIRLQNYQKAEAHADQLSDITLRCHARIDLALALLPENHERALAHLVLIPLERYRCEGIRRLALLNSSDIRPSEQARVREVLCRLTLLAAENPEAMDSVLSRWIQACPDRETILAVADKMGWSTGAGPMFRQAMESLPKRDEEEANTEVQNEADPTPETDAEEAPTASNEDDGFQVVSLTKPVQD